MKCVITVDTEADNQWKSSNTSLTNIDSLHVFQDFMESRGVSPVYFVSHEVLEHPYVQTLAQKHMSGLCEVGGHLHPWTTPPYDEKDKLVQRFPSELPRDVLESKILNLTQRLVEVLGERPLSFRAGKWGFSADVAEVLVQEGYKFDSSITPSIAWSDVIKDPDTHTAVPDFRGISPAPQTLPSGLHEVPMSIIKTGFYTGAMLDSFLWKKNILGKAARAVARPIWCRIFPETTIKDLARVYRSAQKQNLPLIFMIHSSELVAGTSPYAKSEEDVAHIYEVLDAFLHLLKTEGVETVMLKEV